MGSRRELPHVEVMALTTVQEDASLIGAMRAGAIGYMLQNAAPDELRRTIKAAAAGQVQVSPDAAARLVREVQAPKLGKLGPLERDPGRAACRAPRSRLHRGARRDVSLRPPWAHRDDEQPREG